MLLFGGCWLAGGLELEEGDATRGPRGTPRSSSPGGELGSSDTAGLGAAALWTGLPALCQAGLLVTTF